VFFFHREHGEHPEHPVVLRIRDQVAYRARSTAADPRTREPPIRGVRKLALADRGLMITAQQRGSTDGKAEIGLA
jgi:hypothetical protein